MSSTTVLDICGRRRSPATLPSFHRGQPPRNKGQIYAADPPTVDEIIAVSCAAGNSPEGVHPPWERRQAPRGRNGSLGLVAPRTVARAPQRRTGRPAVLRDARSDTKSAVRASRDQSPTAPDGVSSRRTPSIRTAPAPACACGRDVSGGDLADRDPAPARSRRSRDPIPVSPRYRQHRDHPGCASTPRADDPCQQTARTRPLTASHGVTSSGVRPRYSLPHARPAPQRAPAASPSTAHSLSSLPLGALGTLSGARIGVRRCDQQHVARQ